MKTTSQITARIQNWGFFGTLRRNCDMTDAGAATVFDQAAQILVKLTDTAPACARDYLDSMWGRHLADSFDKGSDFADLEKVIRRQLLNYYAFLHELGRIDRVEFARQKQRCHDMRRDERLIEIAAHEMGMALDDDNVPLRRALEAAYAAGAALRTR